MEKIKLINGDCFHDNTKCDYIITSPPYNRKRKTGGYYEYYNDDIKDYYEFIKNYINSKLPSCKYMFLNIQKNYYNDKDIYKIIGLFSDNIIDIIIWEKNNPRPSGMKFIVNSYEFIFIISEKEKNIKTNEFHVKNIFQTNVNSQNQYSEIHRAVMNPIAVEYIVKNFTSENDHVKDDFMGTGTTGEICKIYNRKFTGIEISKEYYEISKYRIENVTEFSGTIFQ